MSKILKFNNRVERIKKWLENCTEGFEEHPPKSALLIWETEDKNGQSCTYHTKYNCDFDDFMYLYKCLEEKCFQMKLDRYFINLNEGLSNE